MESAQQDYVNALDDGTLPEPGTTSMFTNYNVCGEGYYIDPLGLHPRTCRECSVDEDGNINQEGTFETMCSNDVTEWFPAQYTANPDTQHADYNWESINTVLTVEPGEATAQQQNAQDMALHWYTNRMTDQELMGIMIQMGWRSDIEDYGVRLQAFKEEISSGRGSSVSCLEVDDSELTLSFPEGWSADLVAVQPSEEDPVTGRPAMPSETVWDGCDDSGNFGPKNIIQQEYEEWSQSELFEQGQAVTLPDDPLLLGAVIGSVNSDLEQCINDVLNDNDNQSDRSVIELINSRTDITQLTDAEIRFIRRKLGLFLVDSQRGNIKDCITTNLNGMNPCSGNLPEHLTRIITILLSVIGFNLNFQETVNNTDPAVRDKLIDIVDQLGPLIPRSLERIISISKEIERDQCEYVTASTRVLEELYTKVFDRTDQQVNLGFDIGNLLSQDTLDNNGFSRLTILGMLMIAFLKYF